MPESVPSETTLATVTVAAEPLRAEATHRSEQVSEVRGGEWLDVDRVEGDWAWVRGEDGYEGWMATWNLEWQTPEQRQAQLDRWCGRFGKPRGTLWASDHWALRPLSLGEPLLRPEEGERTRGDWTLVSAVDGAEGWVPTDHLQAAGAGGVECVLRATHQLLGTPYRWGGRTPAGLDCSGLVQAVHALAGIALPRDSSQQARVGEDVGLEPAAWRPGDLLFFDDPATHVGILESGESLLHAQGRVRRDLLSTLPPLMARLSGVRRVDQLPGPAPSLWSRRPVARRSP